MITTKPRRRLLFVLALLLALTGEVWAQTAEDPMGYHKGSAYRSVSWENPAGAPGPNGLLLIDIAPAGHVTRWLVADPEGQWRLILTESLDPSRGLATTEIIDDATGWWIRLETRFEIREDTLGAFFQRSDQQPPIDESAGFHDYRLTTSNGLSFSPRIPIKEPKVWGSFFQQLSAAGLADDVAASVPDAFREAVLFLDVSLMDWGSGLPSGIADRPRAWPGLLGLLARVVRSSLPSNDPRLTEFAAPWPMTVGAGGKGSTIVEPELLELASRFRSVENADPLAGHRVDDLAASSDGP